MFVKLVVVACFIAVASSTWHGPLAVGEPAARYPAGVSPHACPNFPYCDNPAVAAHSNAPAAVYAYNAHPGYNHVAAAYNGVYGHHVDASGAYAPRNALESGQYTGDGDYHGEGLAESGAYGDAGAAHYHVPAHYQVPAYYHAPVVSSYAPAHTHVHQLPAGVDAHSCPNYPFCH